MAKCLRRCVAEPKDTVSISAVVAAFKMEAKSKITCVSGFRFTVKISRWLKLIQSTPQQPTRSLGMLNPKISQNHKNKLIIKFT